MESNFGISFNDFVLAVSEIPDDVAEQHFRSRIAFLSNGDGLLVDFVGKLEQFASDWQLLAARFNLTLPPKTHRVSSNRVEMKDIPVSNAALKKLMQRYENDIANFNYRESLEYLLDNK